jgi:hypothetical protein
MSIEFKRRDLLSSMILAGVAAPVVAQDEHDSHEHRAPTGPLASATVSFGAWPSGQTPPLDRFATPDAPVAPNVHQLLPNIVTVRKGGTVNFVVAGFHVVTVYGPGTRPEDINSGDLAPLPGAPPNFPPVINDANNRVYRGVNPLTAPQDRVEVVQFSRRGSHLVICSFLPHFEDRMWGFVRVIA